MVKSIHKISKAFLLVMCLSALPVTMMAEVEEAQNSQIEMGQNQVSISVSGSTIRVKNAEGQALEVTKSESLSCPNGLKAFHFFYVKYSPLKTVK